MAKMQVFTYDNLALYDGLLKGRMSAEDAKSIKTVAIDGNTLKFYKVEEPVGSTEPAYTITLPSADLSGLIPKITGATANNIVTANADGTVKDSGVAVADLATKAEVKTVQDAVDILNGSDTVDGSVAKSIKDLKTTLDADIATAKASGDNAQADVDALEAKVGTVADGKTVVQMISEAQEAATYDDAEVRGLIKNNADAITAINDADTGILKKSKDYTDTTVASAVASVKSSLASALKYKGQKATESELPTEGNECGDVWNVATTSKGTSAEFVWVVDNEETGAGHWEELGTALDLSAYAEKTTVATDIATAKSEAISTAETNAKTYADGLNTAMDTRVASLETKVGSGVEPIPEDSIRALFA